MCSLRSQHHICPLFKSLSFDTLDSHTILLLYEQEVLKIFLTPYWVFFAVKGQKRTGQLLLHKVLTKKTVHVGSINTAFV